MAIVFKGKKGIVFTLIAILMIAVFLVAVAPRQTSDISGRMEITESVIETGQSFVNTVRFSYGPAAMRSASYSALVAISKHQKDAGERFENHAELQRKFAEVMTNGSLDGSPIPQMEDKTLKKRL